MIDRAHLVSGMRQAELPDLSRSTVHYKPVPTSEADLALMAAMDDIQRAFYRNRRIQDELRGRGFRVSGGHVATLMPRMGTEALYPKHRLSKPHPDQTVYPYLLAGCRSRGPGQGW